VAEPRKKSDSGLSPLLLVVPMLACCGLPLLILAGGALVAAVGGPALAVVGVVLLGAVGFMLARRSRAGGGASCCAPGTFEHEPISERKLGQRSSNGRRSSELDSATRKSGRTREPV
jgi:hypothetical protein